MVLNDEGHHAWRPNPNTSKRELDDTEDLEEATVWVDGLDRLNAAGGEQHGIALCVDLSATPFYLKGSGYPEGRPFPWIVSDFGLVDAIESGIVKIPRLPVQDTTGRPDPRYFKLWEAIKQDLQPAELLPGRARKPKPEVVYREAQGALQQIAGQWLERLQYIREATPGQDRVPPVLIIVCDNVDIAEVFYRRISGETEIAAVTEAEVEEVLGEEGEEADESETTPAPRASSKKPKTRTVYGRGDIFPDYLSNTPDRKYTIRIDSKLLAAAESGDPTKKRKAAAEDLRQVVATVGRAGQPGEHVRCVVSVSMLTEGWDANNVTQVLGIRAFGSQLLCEQVVGRGLRRLDYTPDPETGLLTEEYVDVYGIPFSVIPFIGRPTKKPEPDDRPKNHVRALAERASMEMRFPIVEGYAFALTKNLIRCDIERMDRLIIEPNREPTGTYVRAQVGYQFGGAADTQAPFGYAEQNRDAYYRDTHVQTIMFQAAQRIVADLTAESAQQSTDKRRRVLALQARHQLFPQVLRIVQAFVARKVNFQGAPPAELGLQKYIDRLVERIRDAIQPDTTQGEPPLLPLLNRYKEIGTTADVDFKTTRPCYAANHSHINQVVADTKTWETSAAFRIEQAVQRGSALFYARNDGLGLVIPYGYMDVDHSYEPDFLVRLATPGSDTTLILEVKGFEDDRANAKHGAAKRWIEAVNNWGKLGRWMFHVCHNPQTLDRELTFLVGEASQQRAA
jgi:type III restriction enzyme